MLNDDLNYDKSYFHPNISKILPINCLMSEKSRIIIGSMDQTLVNTPTTIYTTAAILIKVDQKA